MSGRADRVLERFGEAAIDALLVTDLVNVRYLTGYTGSNGLVVLSPDRRVFVTDFRYVEQAAEEVGDAWERRQAPQDLLDTLPELLAGDSLRVGFEDHHVSVHEFERLGVLLGERASAVASGRLVELERVVKEPEEIERIRAAAKLADEAFRAVLEQGLAGRTERSVALALEWAMRERGAQGISFEPIVAAGAHGALPHASPRDVEIREGDLIVFDWGARLDGYCSDCTRMVAVGEPGADVREAYEIVLEAQLAGLAAVRPGARGSDVDAIAREVITRAGHGENFGHGLGHGVGLDVHESPTLSRRSQDTLAAGSIVTVEPGVYLPGRFGIRIEDLVVVREDGPEILTGIPKELIVVE